MYTDGNTRTTVSEHLVIPVMQVGEATIESVTAGEPKVVGASDKEHDGLLKLNLFDVALCDRMVHLLRN